MRTYNLSIKKVLISLIVLSTIMIPSIYIVFFAPLDITSDFYDRYYRSGREVSVGVLPVIIYSFIYILYILELIIYKRKEVLIISQEGIKYSTPIYGNIEIPKHTIDDIYISNRNQLKIRYKNLKFKNNIRTKLWNFCISLFIFDTVLTDNTFTIPLNFLKYDSIQEIENVILELDPDTNEARKLINDKLKKYKISDINQLKENTLALNELVIEIHQLKKVKQKDIASILNISTYKVSKIIKNDLK